MRIALVSIMMVVLGCASVAEAQLRHRRGYCWPSEWNRYAFRLGSSQHIDITLHHEPATGGWPVASVLVAVYDEEETDEELQRQLLWWTTEQLSHMRIGLTRSRYTLWFTCTSGSWFQIGLTRSTSKVLTELRSRSRLQSLEEVPAGSDYATFVQRTEQLNRRLASLQANAQ